MKDASGDATVGQRIPATVRSHNCRVPQFTFVVQKQDQKGASNLCENRQTKVGVHSVYLSLFRVFGMTVLAHSSSWYTHANVFLENTNQPATNVNVHSENLVTHMFVF